VIAACGRSGEVENVSLGDAEVLEELPRRVRKIGGYDTTLIGWQIFDRIVECSVGLTASEEVD
jgi:hypothetical protein